MEYMSNEDILSFIDKNTQNELYKILFEQEIDGITFKKMSNESRRRIFKNKETLIIQYEALYSEISESFTQASAKSDSSQIVWEPNEVETENNEKENNNKKKRAKTITDCESLWPHGFVFPKEKVSKNLNSLLMNDNIELNKSNLHELADIIYEEMIFLGFVYPSIIIYDRAVQSIVNCFTHLNKNQIKEVLHNRITYKFCYFRKKAKKLYKHTPAMKAATKAFTPKSKVNKSLQSDGFATESQTSPKERVSSILFHRNN